MRRVVACASSAKALRDDLAQPPAFGHIDHPVGVGEMDEERGSGEAVIIGAETRAAPVRRQDPP